MDPEDLDLNDPFVAQCKDVFDSLDLDKNGMITPYILGQAFKKYGWKTIQPYELVVRKKYPKTELIILQFLIIMNLSISQVSNKA